MKRSIILSLVLLPLFAMAKVPDEADIKAKIQDAASPFYYPNLLLRYEQADSTLTDADYHYLYYGYAYQPEYEPLNSDPALDRIYDLLSHLNADRPDPDDLESLIENGRASLKHDPFSPQVLNFVAFAYALQGDEIRAARYSDRMNRILQTIASSGDGRTEKSPYHILMFQHALDLMATNGLEHGDARIVSRTVEYIPLLKKDENGRRGYYFDYSRIYRNKPSNPAPKAERTWQFNNLKPQKW